MDRSAARSKKRASPKGACSCDLRIAFRGRVALAAGSHRGASHLSSASCQRRVSTPAARGIVFSAMQGPGILYLKPHGRDSPAYSTFTGRKERQHLCSRAFSTRRGSRGGSKVTGLLEKQSTRALRGPAFTSEIICQCVQPRQHQQLKPTDLSENTMKCKNSFPPGHSVAL